MLGSKKLENILAAILTGLCAFAVTFLKDMSDSVAELNEKISVVVEKIAYNSTEVNDHEVRLRAIEARRHM